MREEERGDSFLLFTSFRDGMKRAGVMEGASYYRTRRRSSPSTTLTYRAGELCVCVCVCVLCERRSRHIPRVSFHTPSRKRERRRLHADALFLRQQTGGGGGPWLISPPFRSKKRCWYFFFVKFPPTRACARRRPVAPKSTTKAPPCRRNPHTHALTLSLSRVARLSQLASPSLSLSLCLSIPLARREVFFVHHPPHDKKTKKEHLRK